MTKKYTGIGRPTLRLAPATSPRLPFRAETTCVQCGAAMVVNFGVVAAVFRIGAEFVGLVCDACLDAPSQAKLLARRRMMAVQEDA